MTPNHPTCEGDGSRNLLATWCNRDGNHVGRPAYGAALSLARQIIAPQIIVPAPRHRPRCSNFLRVIISICAIFIPVRLWGADNTDPHLMTQIYAFFSGSSRNADTTMTLMVPGLIIDSWLDPDDLRDTAKLCKLLDINLSPPRRYLSWTSSPAQSATPDIYWKILSESDWSDTPLTKKQKTRLTEATRLLYRDAQGTQPTEGYSLYISLKKDYDTALAAMNATPPAKRTAVMKQKLEEARDSLRIEGEETKYKSALDDYRTLSTYAGQKWLTQLKQTWEDNQLALPDGSTVPHTVTHPDLFDAVSLTAWTPVRFDISSAAPLQANTKFRAPASMTLLHWGDETTPSDRDSTSATQLATATISLDMIRLPIDREWLTSTVFQSHAWKWSDPADRDLISDGKPWGAETKPSGLMPVLSSAVILVRNVTVTGSWPDGELRALRKVMRTKHFVSWGPFMLAGRPFGSPDSPTIRAVPIKHGFRVYEPQLTLQR